MDFDIPQDIQQFLNDLDDFIEAEIKPLEEQDDNVRFFDHRREFARTDWERGGVPRAEWYALLGEMRRRADAAGLLRWALPSELGGADGSNLGMAIIREHLAAMGLGLGSLVNRGPAGGRQLGGVSYLVFIAPALWGLRISTKHHKYNPPFSLAIAGAAVAAGGFWLLVTGWWPHPAVLYVGLAGLVGIGYGSE